LQLAEVQKRMAELDESPWSCILRAGERKRHRATCGAKTSLFLGRKPKLLDLHNRLRVFVTGVVTAVYGLGGQGKTELAFTDCPSAAQ
jgi:hypothetical protein